jgi:hypothetical protein
MSGNEINVAETYQYIEEIAQLCAATPKYSASQKARALAGIGDIKLP